MLSLPCLLLSVCSKVALPIICPQIFVAEITKSIGLSLLVNHTAIFLSKRNDGSGYACFCLYAQMRTRHTDVLRSF